MHIQIHQSKFSFYSLVQVLHTSAYLVRPRHNWSYAFISVKARVTASETARDVNLVENGMSLLN